MKVKIANAIYDSNEEPIMLILEDEDKENIKNMDEDYHKYLSYPDNLTEDEAKKFMKVEE